MLLVLSVALLVIAVGCCFAACGRRDLRGFVGSVRSDEGLASLAGGGRQAEELARSDRVNVMAWQCDQSSCR